MNNSPDLLDDPDLTYDGHSKDYVSQPCVRCGFQRRLLPDWAKNRAVFAVEGKSYRIVAEGSSNVDTNTNGAHFQDYVSVEQLPERWTLPTEGQPVAELGASLKALFKMRRFTTSQLKRAIRVLP